MGEQHPVGTPLFFVPIRFWEDHPIETGRVALHTKLNGEVIPSWTSDGFVYAFHDGYGHSVYMTVADDVFLTREDAIACKERRASDRKAQEDVEFKALMSRILARHATPTKKAPSHG